MELVRRMPFHVLFPATFPVSVLLVDPLIRIPFWLLLLASLAVRLLPLLVPFRMIPFCGCTRQYY